MNTNDYGIYKITNIINGISYIGQTATSFNKRWSSHKKDLRKNCHSNRHLQNAFNLYGEDCFEFKAIHICDELDDLNKLEIYYIFKYDTFENGYNLTAGGDGTYYFDEEQRKRILKYSKENLSIKRGMSPNVIIGIKKALVKPTKKLFKSRMKEIASVFNVSENIIKEIRYNTAWQEIGQEYNAKISSMWSKCNSERMADRALTMLFDDGLTIAQIAEKLTIDESKIRQAFSYNHVKFAQKNKENKFNQRKTYLKKVLSENEIQTIEELVRASGVSRAKIRNCLTLEELEYLTRKPEKEIKNESGENILVKSDKKRFNKEKNIDIKGINFDNASKRWIVKHTYNLKQYVICTTKDLNKAKLAKQKCKTIKNIEDLYRIKEDFKGVPTPKKMIKVLNSRGEYLYSVLGIGETARKLDIDRKSIEKVLWGKQKITHGYKFEYE